jgi:Caspase domain
LCRYFCPINQTNKTINKNIHTHTHKNYSLIPVDFQTAGHIIDDDLIQMLVKPMPAGVTMTVLMDCCHSGTVLDLPYKISATDTEFVREENFNMDIVSEPVRKDRGPVDYSTKKLPKKKKGKKKKKYDDDEYKKDLAPDAPVGPKLAPNGMPVLPIRKKMNVKDIQDEHDDPLNEDELVGDNCTDVQQPEQAQPKKKGILGKLFRKKK